MRNAEHLLRKLVKNSRLPSDPHVISIELGNPTFLRFRTAVTSCRTVGDV